MTLNIDSNIKVNFDILDSVPNFWDFSSYWYKKIPENPPLRSNSIKMVNRFLTTPEHYGGTFQVNIHSWSYPLYYAKSNTPKVNVYRSNGEVWSRGYDVPIPVEAKADPQTDQSLKIVDFFGGKVYDGWSCKFDGSKWVCGAWWNWDVGGSGIGKNFEWVMGGASIPAAAILLLPEEIEAGVINHPLGMGLRSSCRSKSWIYPPACNSDGRSTLADSIPSGARLQLNPSIDVDSLNVNRATKIILRCMQEYGIVNKENAGRSVIYAENPICRTVFGLPDPWAGLGVTKDMLKGAFMKELSWQIPDWEIWNGDVYQY